MMIYFIIVLAVVAVAGGIVFFRVRRKDIICYDDVSEWFRDCKDPIWNDIIYYDDIVKWFRERNDIKEADKDNIAFTIIELENGVYKVIQGIFNKRTNKLEECRVMQAEKIDEELAKTHVEKELVLYE